MDNNYLLIILGFLGSGTMGGLIMWFLNKRQNKANVVKTEKEAANEEADTVKTYMETNRSLQEQNQKHWERIVSLETLKVEQERTIGALQDRLAERDTQLSTMNKQFERMSKLAEQAPVTETLREQVSTAMQMIGHMQKAVEVGKQLLDEQVRANEELRQTNRDLALRKPDGSLAQ